MGLDAIKQNLTRSLTGNIVKAVLCVRDPSKIDDDEDAQKAKGDAAALNESLLKDIQKRLDKAGKKKGAAAAVGGVANAVTGSNSSTSQTYDDIKDKVKDKGYIPIEVQYNPTTLRLSTTAGFQLERDSSSTTAQISSFDAVPSTILYCDLMFNDTNIQDAFMLENNPVTNLSTGNVYSAIKSAAKGKYSVQDQMEGLVSLFAVPQAKEVIFFWGNMSFRGEMVDATANYTMFNKKGYPIRGVVSIQIRQGAKIQEYSAEHKYWNWAFDRCFGKKGINDEKGGQSTFEKVTNNNLLNLRL